MEKKNFDKITLKIGWNLLTDPSEYFIILCISKTECYLHQNGVEYDLMNFSIKIFPATTTMIEYGFKTSCTLKLVL